MTGGFTVRARANEAGAASYVVVPDGASAPSAAQVKAGLNAAGASALRAGSILLTANTEGTGLVSGLSSNTAYDVYVIAEDAVIPPNLQVSPVKLDITTAATDLQSWRFTYFGTVMASGNAANDADPDGDGVANLLEYAFATEPNDSVSGIDNLPVANVAGNAVTLTFTPQEINGLSFVIECSSDLTDWSEQTTVTANLTPGVPYTYTDTANIQSVQRRFLRLRVTASE